MLFNATNFLLLFSSTTMASKGKLDFILSKVSTADFLPITSKYFPTKTKVIIIATESK